ncbi:hypothetical protein ACFVTP_25370 [Streptomyces celluloflavus]|uniref:hypothetical protein n=1 Tax=Streptomyces celluloflavus TaxID=58344 RepID=UPI0036DF5E73
MAATGVMAGPVARRPREGPAQQTAGQRGGRAGEGPSGANFDRCLPVDYGGDESVPALFVPGTAFSGAYWPIHLRHLVGSRQEMTALFHIDNAELGYGLVPAGLPISRTTVLGHNGEIPEGTSRL